MKSNLWLSVLLSAAVFNVAFLFQDALGVLIIFFLPVLGYFFCNKHTLSICFRAGLLWGICVFIVHFTWMLLVFVRHTSLHVCFCVLLYMFVVCYFAVFSGLWFMLAGLLQRFFFLPFSLMISFSAYLLTLEYAIVIPLGLEGGYPLLNPLIPLMHSRLALKCIFYILGFLTSNNPRNHNKSLHTYTYLEPIINKVKQPVAQWESSPCGLGQKVYLQLLKKVSTDHPQVFVSPESFFPYPLNRFKALIRLWSSAIKQNDHLLIGSTYQEEEQMYQCVYWIHGGLIINYYVKKHRVPFFEDAFSSNTGRHTCSLFDINQERIIPQICSEFFFKSSSAGFIQYRHETSASHICFFVNDSWFDCFFKQCLYGLTCLKGLCIGMPVLYIGHDGFKLAQCNQVDTGVAGPALDG